MSFSLSDIHALLASRDFDALVGKVENAWFDGKDQPYDVGKDSGKRELAKDIAAFANSAGGVIVIGARTKKSTAHFGDEVTKIRPLRQELLDPGQYRNILADWVFPKLDGVEIDWLATLADPTRGLFVIRIPAQQDELKPFLVVRTPEAGKIAETFFSYAERRGDSNSPMGIVDLQRTLRVGLNFERRLDERLLAIETILRNPSPKSPLEESVNSVAKVKERVDSALADSDFAGERSLTLVAEPSADNELATIFSSAEDSIRRKLERPPTYRDNGWDLTMGGYAQIIRGEMIRVQGFRKVAHLYRDGTFVFACAANEDFLAWTSKVQQLHPMGLVEIFYNYVAFYELVRADLRRPAADLTFTTAFRNLHAGNAKTKLGAYAYGSFGQLMSDLIHQAPDDAVTLTRRVSVDGRSVGEIALDLVREVYLWFGLDEDKIPYTGTHDGRRFIDREALMRA